MSIEQIIRPNETTRITPEREPPANPIKPERVRITAGMVGSVKTTNGSASAASSHYMDARHNEGGTS